MNLHLKTTALLIALMSLSAHTVSAGLLLTDNADPVEIRHLELEINGIYQDDSEKSSGVSIRTSSTDADITMTTGVARGLDLAVVLPYTVTGREEVNGSMTSRVDGFSDMTVDLKYQFLDLGGVKLAVKPGIILPTGKYSEGFSDGRAGFRAKLIATKEFHEGKVALHANAGYEQHDYRDAAVRETTRGSIYSFSAACEVEVAGGLKIALDSGIYTNLDKNSNTPHAYALTGAKYEFDKAVEVYAGMVVGLTNPEADLIARYGIVFKF